MENARRRRKNKKEEGRRRRRGGRGEGEEEEEKRNNPLHVKTNTNICPYREPRKRIKGRMILVMEMENDKSMDFFAGKKLPPGGFRIQSIDATLVGMKLQSSIAKRPPPQML